MPESASCEPVLQSSTEQWGAHFAKTSAAVHWCWLTAHLAVNQHQCTAQGKMSSPRFSAALQKTGSQLALCHRVYTYPDLLFIHVCNEPAPMHCSIGFGRMSSPAFSAALQNRLTPMQICCSYEEQICRGYNHGDKVQAVSLFCRAALNTGVCNSKTPMHCPTGHGKIAFPQFSVALQNRLTAGFCRCSSTYGDLLFIQMCSGATPMHCSVQGKIVSPLFSVALQNRLTA